MIYLQLVLKDPFINSMLGQIFRQLFCKVLLYNFPPFFKLYVRILYCIIDLHQSVIIQHLFIILQPFLNTNWTLYYSASTLGQVQIKSKLCYNSQTKYIQVVNNWIYSICRRSYMVVTHNSSTQEKWKTKNLYRFQKIKCSQEEGSILITFYG